MCPDVFSASFASPSFCFVGQSLLLATALFGSMFYLFGRRRSQHQNGPSECPQAIELEDSPGVFKSGMLKDRPTELVIERFFPEVGTLWDAFQRGLAKSEKGPCLGWRPTPNSPYEFITFGQVAEKSKSLGAALIGKLGLEPGNGTFVGIYAKNCPEWTITALACVRHSMVVVPLYDTLGADSAAFILSHTEAKVVVVDELERLENILSMEGKVPELRHILLVERPKEEGKMEEMGRRAAKNGWKIHLLGELVQNGGGKQEDHEPKAEDIYIVCYTSGTTGTPKGVVLSHKNVVANLSGMAVLFDKFLPNLMESTEHSVISYLPLSHMFEQCCHWAALCLGFRVGFFSGNIAKLSGDMQALEPTLFPVVPRLLNRFNDTIKAELARSSPIKRWLFSLAKSQKSALYEKGIVTNGTIWDRMVFSKAQKQLGGKVQLIVTGSAPIAAEVLKELRIIFGTQIIEGYGQTECTAMATCTIPGDTTGGHCGGPAACTLLKLADVPELNYLARERKGEVMVKGPSVTKGYYRDEEKTAELFDDQGFLHTGDIGHLLPNGTLRIIDRKKHIFKLAQGEYVAPEKIENVYIQCSLVQQIYVDGDSLERFLVAVVVPPEKAIRRIYGEMGEDGREKSFEEICMDKRVKKAILEEMGKIGKEQRLNSIEKVKAIHVEAEMFSVENGLLTPTLKAKRPQLRQKYRETIEKLYREIDGRQS